MNDFMNCMNTKINKIIEITVFANGDSRKISTWSNIPYFFTRNLLLKGIKVNRVDLSPKPILNIIYNKSIGKIIKKIYGSVNYEYFRTFTHFYICKILIDRSVKRYWNSDIYIFLTYSFSSAGMTSKPTIHLCDWTYEYYIKYFKEREPNFLERRCIKRENKIIRSSNLIISLFPVVTEYLKNSHKNTNILYIGNVVNTLYDSSKKIAFQKRKESNNILFIGGKKYIEGAKTLIDAFQICKLSIPNIKLHIIGLNKNDFTILPTDVYCYGYLDKGNEIDRKNYYDLIYKSKLFVNTTPKWGAFSATLEAMYFYVPVIIYPYNDFIKTFGKKIDFGCYCHKNDPGLISEKIKYILNNANYKNMCINANKNARGYTWEKYTIKFLEVINKIVLKNKRRNTILFH